MANNDVAVSGKRMGFTELREGRGMKFTALLLISVFGRATLRFSRAVFLQGLQRRKSLSHSFVHTGE
jgi:hypothetical protein